MFCPKCGSRLDDNARFCLSCGADLSVQADEQPAEPISSYSEPESSYSGVATATLPKAEDAPAYKSPKAEIAIKPKKKNKAVKPIIITASIIAVLGVGGFVCKSKFSPAIYRTIMGDQGYAISLMERSAGELVSSADTINSVTANVLPSLYSVSSGDTYIDSALYANMYAGAVLNAIGTEGITITQNINVTPLSEFDSFVEGVDDKYIDFVNALGDYNLSASISNSKSGREAFSSLTYQGNVILDAGLSYPRNGKNSYFILPAITDQYVTLTLPGQVTNADIDTDELNNLYLSMLDVVKYYYKDAEISYTNGQETIGDISFNGDIVTVTFDQETISNILGDMADVIADSDLKDLLSSNSILGELVSFLQDEQNYIYYISDSNCYLDFTTYVNPDGTIAGNKIKYRENHRSDKKSFDFLSLSEGRKYTVYAKINGIKMVDVRVDGKNNTSGNAVIRLALSDNDTAVFVVDYKDCTFEKLHDLPVIKGSYTITPYLSDNLIYSLSTLGLNADMLYSFETNPITLDLCTADNIYKLDMVIGSIAQITAETTLSDDTIAVSKKGDEININDIEEIEKNCSNYLSSLDDPLFALINNCDSDTETFEESDTETSESYFDF